MKLHFATIKIGANTTVHPPIPPSTHVALFASDDYCTQYLEAARKDLDAKAISYQLGRRFVDLHQIDSITEFNAYGVVTKIPSVEVVNE